MPSEGYRRVDSIDSQAAVATASAVNTPHHERMDSEYEKRQDTLAAGDEDEIEFVPRNNDDLIEQEREQQQQRLPGRIKPDHRMRQKKFATQRSILKNSQDNTATTTTNEELELLEAKKQMILRRRRLFSHYRQYQEWRRRQFSYDPCSYRAIAPPIMAPSFCSSGLVGATGDYTTGHATNRRRRQYRRQFSCAERSREDSRESRESSHLAKCHSMGASDTVRTDSTILNYTNPTTERHSVSYFCGAQTLLYRIILHVQITQIKKITSNSKSNVWSMCCFWSLKNRNIKKIRKKILSEFKHSFVV